VQPLLQLKSKKYYIFWVCVCSLRYPARKAHAPYCHLWRVPLYNIFPHYPIKGTIFSVWGGRVIDIPFVSILCTCCSHSSWHCLISFTMFCVPVSCLIHWFFSLSSFVIPSKCLENLICAASKRHSSLFFSTTKRTKEHRMTEEEMEGPTSSWGLRNRKHA